MSGSGIQGWDVARYTREYEKTLVDATKKAGRQVGPKVVRNAKAALGNVSPERKSKVVYKVRRNGTIVFIDSGIDSRRREYGLLIKALPGHALRINFSKEDRKKDGDFVMEVDGKAFLMEGEGDNAMPIAVLKREIREPAVETEKRLSTLADAQFDEFLARIGANIVEGP